MTNRKFIKLTEDGFDEKFKLITNPFEDNVGWNGRFFETYGEELDFVRNRHSAHIWTYIDGDESDLIVSGYHLVNRINYLISVEHVPDDTDYQVNLDRAD